MKGREVLKLLKAAGWQEVRTNGSHRQLQHPDRPGTVMVPMHSGDDLKLPTLKSIERQSGVTLRRK